MLQRFGDSGAIGLYKTVDLLTYLLTYLLNGHFYRMLLYQTHRRVTHLAIGRSATRTVNRGETVSVPLAMPFEVKRLARAASQEKQPQEGSARFQSTAHCSAHCSHYSIDSLIHCSLLAPHVCIGSNLMLVGKHGHVLAVCSRVARTARAFARCVRSQISPERYIVATCGFTARQLMASFKLHRVRVSSSSSS